MKKNSHYSQITLPPILLIGAVVITTFAVYWQMRSHEFIDYDDRVYITENPNVQKGLSLEGLKWAFETTHGANWHPVTWLSHMLDCQLFGLDPVPHHLVNLLLHLANTVLLFLFFNRVTKSFWPGAFIAAVFALHPLHVESVAWIAERKDVLSTFFWLLTMLAYTAYCKKPGIARYTPVILCFALGLMAKPMLVTLPFVLLLLDYWPLKRLRLSAITEKIPLFGLALISCLVTLYAQKAGGAVKSINFLPAGIRIQNAVVSYIAYIAKSFWPAQLAVFYPHPHQFPIWKSTGAALLLICFLLLVIKKAQNNRYLVTGSLFYIITLLPVIGIIQVGDQAMADRYMYIPMTGILIIIAWGVPALLAKWQYRKIFMTLCVTLVLTASAVRTYSQVASWETSLTLFEHAINVTQNNFLAYCGRGNALLELKRFKEAISDYQRVVEICPNYHEVYKIHGTLAKALIIQGKIDQALYHSTKALDIHPDHETHFSQANVLRHGKQTEKAIFHYRKAIEIKSDYAEAHNNLAAVFTLQNKFTDAIEHYERAVNLKPDYIEAHINYGVTLRSMKKYQEAAGHFKEALRLDPDNQNARKSLDALKKH